MSDKYQISVDTQIASPEELAPEQVVHLMLDYKFAVIDLELNNCRMQLTLPQVTQNPEESTKVLQRFMTLSQVQRLLAKRLGDRIYR
jgi:hypothetical protein